MESEGIKKGKSKTIFSFYKAKEDTSTSSQQPPSNDDQCNSKRPRIEVDVYSLERDPGLRTPIWQLPVNQRDEIRRAYIKMGPHQPILLEYPRKKLGNQNRRFQSSWFQKFPWIEYSPSKDAVFCFPCFLFENKSAKFAAFTIDGFNSWKRVNDGERCSLLLHAGGKNSQHNNNVKAIDDLMNVTKHIDKVINVHDKEDIQKNSMRLKATVESVRWLSLQACPFRGHDESTSSRNQGNFIEMLRLLGRMNVDIDNLILEKAPQNAKYTSPQIQKDVLHVLATKVRNKIREDI